MTLRDGLQSFPRTVPTTAKIQIYDLLVSAGLKNLQVTSFVNPARLPQLADAETLFLALADRPARRSVLVANARGFERAVACGAKEIEAVVSVSETYNEKNAHRTIQKSMDEIKWMSEQAAGTEAIVSIGLANCYHCVFEGPIQADAVFSLVEKLHTWGVREIGLSDTTGYATPEHVYELSQRAMDLFPDVEFGAHLHDTRGRGLANAMGALAAGIRWFDASLGGLGGSPFAPGMGGNLSLESFVDCVDTMGIFTGVQAIRLVAASAAVSDILRRC